MPCCLSRVVRIRGICTVRCLSERSWNVALLAAACATPQQSGARASLLAADETGLDRALCNQLRGMESSSSWGVTCLRAGMHWYFRACCLHVVTSIQLGPSLRCIWCRVVKYALSKTHGTLYCVQPRTIGNRDLEQLLTCTSCCVGMQEEAAAAAGGVTCGMLCTAVYGCCQDERRVGGQLSLTPLVISREQHLNAN
jgi:hypothetical protein